MDQSSLDSRSGVHNLDIQVVNNVRICIFGGIFDEPVNGPRVAKGATRLYLYFITCQRAHGRLMIQLASLPNVCV